MCNQNREGDSDPLLEKLRVRAVELLMEKLKTHTALRTVIADSVLLLPPLIHDISIAGSSGLLE